MTSTQEERSQVAELEQAVQDLTRALASRPIIDQAIGITMERHRCSAEDAFRRLVGESQSRNVKLRQVASELVRDVGGVEPQPPPFLPRARRACDDV